MILVFLQRIAIIMLCVTLLWPTAASFALAPKSNFSTDNKPAKAQPKPPDLPARLALLLTKTKRPNLALTLFKNLAKHRTLQIRNRKTGKYHLRDKLTPDERVTLIEALLSSRLDNQTLVSISHSMEEVSACLNFLAAGLPINASTADLVRSREWKDALQRLTEALADAVPGDTFEDTFPPTVDGFRECLEASTGDMMLVRNILRKLRPETLANTETIRRAMALAQVDEWRDRLLSEDTDDLLDFTIAVLLQEEIASGTLTDEMRDNIFMRLKSEPRLSTRMAMEIEQRMQAHQEDYDTAWKHVLLDTLGVPAGARAAMLDVMTRKFILSAEELAQASQLLAQGDWSAKLAAGDTEALLDLMFEIRPERNKARMIRAAQIRHADPGISRRLAYQMAEEEHTARAATKRALPPSKPARTSQKATPPKPAADPSATSASTAAPGRINREAKPSSPVTHTDASPEAVPDESQARALKDKTAEILAKYPHHSPADAENIAARILAGEPYRDAWRIVYLMSMGLRETEAKKRTADLRQAQLVDKENRKALRILIKHLGKRKLRDFLSQPGLKENVALFKQWIKDKYRPMHPLLAVNLVLSQGDTQDKRFTAGEQAMLQKVSFAAQQAIENDKYPVVLIFDSPDAPEIKHQDEEILQGLSRKFPDILHHDTYADIWTADWIDSGSLKVTPKAEQFRLRMPGEPLGIRKVALLKEDVAGFESALADPAYALNLREMLSRMKSEMDKGTVFFFDSRGNPLAFHQEGYGDSLNRFAEYLLRKHKTLWVLGMPAYEEGRLPGTCTHLSSERLPDDGAALTLEQPLKDAPGKHAKLMTKWVKAQTKETLDTDYLAADDLESILSQIDGKKTLDEIIASSPPAHGHAARPLLHTEQDGILAPIAALPSNKIGDGTNIWRWLQDAQGQTVYLDKFHPMPGGQVSFIFSMGLGRRDGFDPGDMEWRMTPRKDGVEIRVNYKATKENPSPKIFLFNIDLPETITASNPVFAKAPGHLLTARTALEGETIFLPTERERQEIPKLMIGAELFTQTQWDNAQEARPKEKLADLLARNNGSLYDTVKEFYEQYSRPLLFLLDESGRPFDFFEGWPDNPAFLARLDSYLNENTTVWIAGPKINTRGEVSHSGFGKEFSLKRIFEGDPYVALRVEKRRDLVTHTVSLKGAKEYIATGVLQENQKIVRSVLAYLMKRKGRAWEKILVDADPEALNEQSLRAHLADMKGDHLLIQGIHANPVKKTCTVLKDMPDTPVPEKFLQDGGGWMEAKADLGDFSVHADSFKKIADWKSDRHSGVKDMLPASKVPYSDKALALLHQITFAAQKAARNKDYHVPVTLSSERTWSSAEHILKELAHTHPGIVMDISGEHPVIIADWIRDSSGKPFPKPPRIILDCPDHPYVYRGVPLTAMEILDIERKLAAMTAAELPVDAAGRKKDMEDNQAIFVWDAKGNILWRHAGDITFEFNDVLEYLLREHKEIWVEGIKTAQDRSLPRALRHITRPYALINADTLAIEPSEHVAIRIIKGYQGKSIERKTLSVDDFEQVLEKATKKHKDLNDILEDQDNVPAKGSATHIPVYVETAEGMAPLTTYPKEVRDRTFLWELLRESRGLPVEIRHLSTTKTGKFSAAFSTGGLNSLSRLREEWPIVWRASVKKNGVEIRITYQPKDGEQPAETNLFNIPLPAAITQTNAAFRNAQEFLLKDKKALGGGRIAEAFPEKIPDVEKDMLDARLISQEEYDAAVEKDGKDEDIETLPALLASYGGSVVKAAREHRKGLVIFYEDNADSFDLHEGSVYGDKLGKKLSQALKRHPDKQPYSFWMAGPRLKERKVLQSLPEFGTVAFDHDQFAVGDPVALHIVRSPTGRPMIEKAVSFDHLEEYLRGNPAGKNIAVLPSVKATLVQGEKRTLIGARPAHLTPEDIRSNIPGGMIADPENDYILLEGVRANEKHPDTSYLRKRTHRFGEEANGKPLIIRLNPLDLSVRSFEILQEETLPARGSGMAALVPPDGKQYWQGQGHGLFGPDPFEYGPRTAGIAELSDTRWVRAGGPRHDASHQHVRNGNGFGNSLSAMSVADREMHFRDFFHWPPAVVNFLARQEPNAAHFEFYKGLVQDYDMEPLAALAVHKNIRQEIFENPEYVPDALAHLDPSMDKRDWLRKLLEGKLASRIGFMTMLFEDDIPKEDFQNVKDILLQEPRHTLAMALAIVHAMSKENKSYDEIWRTVYLKLMGVRTAVANAAQDMFTPEMVLGKQAKALEQLLKQGVRPAHAAALLKKEGDIAYHPDELDLLAKITVAMQKARDQGKKGAVVRFASDEMLLDLASLTELSQEHPSIKKPDLMKFDYDKRLVWPRWMINKEFPRAPMVRLMVSRSWPGYLSPTHLRDTLIARIKAMESLHSHEMAEAIADRILETKESYWKAWTFLCYRDLGVPEEKIRENREGIPADLLLNRNNHPWLKLLLAHLSPTMAKAIAVAPMAKEKAETFDMLVTAGVDPFTARQLLLMAGDSAFAPDDMLLLRRLTLAGQAAAERPDNRSALQFPNGTERDEALAGLSRLAGRLGPMDLDTQQGIAVVPWIMGKNNRPFQMAPRVLLSVEELPKIGPAVLLTQTEKSRIEADIARMDLTDGPGQRLEKIKKQFVYFFDDKGNVVAVYEGNIGSKFDALLEFLLGKYKTVWAQGIPLTDKKLLPDSTAHIERRSALTGMRKPFIKKNKHLAVRFSKGYFGNTLDQDYMGVEDFERLLKLPAERRAQFKPKQGMHKQNLVFVQTADGLKPFATIPTTVKEYTNVWKLFSMAGGLPIAMTHHQTMGKDKRTAKFPFLFLGDTGKRNVAHAKRPAHWQMSAAKDGFEFRVTYLDKEGKADKERPEIHLFNIKLPDILTARHPYFHRAMRYMLKDTEGMEGVFLNWASAKIEMPVIRDGLIEAGFFTREQWEEAMEAEKQLGAADRLSAALKAFNGSITQAAKSAKGLTVFYDKNGKLMDFYPGSQYKKETREIWQRMLDSGEEFWVSGPVLENRASLQGLPDLGWTSYDRLGLEQGNVIALRIRKNLSGKPMIMQTMVVPDIAVSGEDMPQGDRLIESLKVYLVRKETNGVKMRVLVAAHPNSVKLEEVRNNLPPLQKGDYLWIENLFIPESGAAKAILSGMEPHRFPKALNFYGKYIQGKIDPRTFAIEDKNFEIMTAGMTPYKSSGIPVLVAPGTEPAVIHNFTGRVLQRLRAGEGTELSDEQRTNLIAGLEKLSADHTDLARDYLARKDFWLVKDLPRLAKHLDDGLFALEESSAGHADIAALKAYHEMLHDVMESHNPYLEEILVKKRELEYLFGGAFGDAAGPRVAALLDYLRANDRIEHSHFARLAEDYRDLMSGKHSAETPAAVYVMIAAYVDRTGDETLLGGKVDTGHPFVAEQLDQMETFLNMRVAMKKIPTGPLTPSEIQAQAASLLGHPRGHVGDELANPGLSALGPLLDYFVQDYGHLLTDTALRDDLNTAVEQTKLLMSFHSKYHTPEAITQKNRKAPAAAFIAINEELLQTVRKIINGTSRLKEHKAGTEKYPIFTYSLEEMPSSKPLAVLLNAVKRQLLPEENIPAQWIEDWEKLKKMLGILQATLAMQEFETYAGDRTELVPLLDKLWSFLSHNRGFIAQTSKGKVETARDIPPLLGSPTWIRQILMSAAYLAGHSSPDQPGAALRITAMPDGKGGVLVEILAEGGTGLTARELESIREELRWPTVERMMEALGGKISYEAEDGKTASVRMTFAAAQQTPAAGVNDGIAADSLRAASL